MRILITGSNGMLGQALLKELAGKHEVIGLDHHVDLHAGRLFLQCDITDQTLVRTAFRQANAQWVIHAAAMTDVDACERQPEVAERVNVDGAAYVAEAAGACKMRGIYVSSDFVFSGKKTTPYDEEDAPDPINVYGRTKREGTVAWQKLLPRGIVLRTSWLFGAGKKGFVDTVAEQAESGGTLKVVSDQWGSPTYVKDLAQGIIALIEAAEAGDYLFPKLFHFSNTGATSRYLWAKFIVKTLGKNPDQVQPILSEYDGRSARRPVNSMLSLGLWRKILKYWPRDIWTATSDYLKNGKRHAATIV